MSQNLLLGPTCQSCGVALIDKGDFGTNTSGAIVTDYCKFCFAKGAFVDPDITLEEMIVKSTAVLAKKKGVNAGKAEAMAERILPGLERWKAKH